MSSRPPLYDPIDGRMKYLEAENKKLLEDIAKKNNMIKLLQTDLYQAHRELDIRDGMIQGLRNRLMKDHLK